MSTTLSSGDRVAGGGRDSGQTMKPGREAQSEDVVFCGEPLDSRSPPLASESTEADDNNSGHRRNSMSPRLSFPADGSVPVSLKHSPHPFVSGTSAARDLVAHNYSNQSWSTGEENHADRSPHGSNNAKATPQPPHQPSKSSAGSRPRARPPTSRLSDPGSSDSSPAVVSEASASSLRAIEVENDDGVAVYIDDVEDDDSYDGIVITEHRISARRAAEILAYKSKWVAKMLHRRDRILGVSSSKVAPNDRAHKNIKVTENVADTPPEADCGPEFLKRKLEGFAACMTPEALECIERQDRSWEEASSDSDEAPSANGISHPTRCRLANRTLEAASSGGHRMDLTAKSNAPARVLKPRRRQCYGKDGQLGFDSSAVALRAWGRFLKYVRKTCRALSPRPRIERTAGLESDDDDEQAPLYMCRPGSVQRPSPLISHSLTEHLRASNTLFFKHFARRIVSAPVSFQGGAFPAAASAEEQKAEQKAHTLPHVSVATPTAGQSSTARESAFSAINDVPAHASAPSSEAACQDAVPLFQITAEASAMFGDLMRLEDTMRMLDASCTFRLAAAPFSTIRNKNGQPKGHARTRSPSKSTRTPHGKGLSSLASNAQTVALGSPRYTENGRVRAISIPPVPLQEPTAGKPAGGYSRRASPPQMLVCASSGSERGMQEKRTSNRNPSGQTEDSRIIYTLQADEETLALSGLDSGYCARVEFASQGAHRARESLAHLEVPQLNGTPAQESKPASAAAQMKKRRKAADEELSSGDDDSGNECMAVDEASSSTASREEATEEADRDRSLMADKLLLAHLMPYLPQLGPT